MAEIKIAVYTCIVDDYDVLLPPCVRSDGVRFFCFTDRTDRKVRGWEMLDLAHPSSVTRPDLINRYHKFFPYRVLPDVDWSIYIDGNIRLIGDIPSLIKRISAQGAVLGCPEHKQRSTILEEARACKELGKFDQRDKKLIKKQLAIYKAEGMPLDTPLTANYLIIRSHKSNELANAMELWWKQLQLFTRRDQISLPYVLWKTGLAATLIEKDVNESEPYYTHYAHKISGISGWKQRIYLRRNEALWCRALYLLRKWLLPR